tara:strand:+ start:314 stop:448 length:135 start_codon:yes stop_codon:yes gene_type:complete
MLPINDKCEDCNVDMDFVDGGYFYEDSGDEVLLCENCFETHFDD